MTPGDMMKALPPHRPQALLYHADPETREVLLFRGRFDLDNDGINEDIAGFIDVESGKLLFVDYAENIAARGGLLP